MQGERHGHHDKAQVYELTMPNDNLAFNIAVSLWSYLRSIEAFDVKAVGVSFFLDHFNFTTFNNVTR